MKRALDVFGHVHLKRLASHTLDHLACPVRSHPVHPARPRLEHQGAVAATFDSGGGPGSFAAVRAPLEQKRV